MFIIEKLAASLRQAAQPGQLFDLYRLVDPATHDVYDLVDGNLIKSGEKCYALWGRPKPCNNCISQHTCMERKAHFKLEYLDKTVYLIDSVPVDVGDRLYSLELAKDVTDSMLTADSYNGGNAEVTTIIQDFNALAVLDLFTGLYNKVYLLSQLLNFIGGDLPGVETLTGAMLDLDHFKEVNDVYGHYMGDVVLKTVAERLKKEADEESVWAGRMGGDEFIIFFANLTLEQTVERCGRMVRDMEKEVYRKDDASFRIGVSFGAAQVEKTDTTESYLDKLDKKMYQDKAEKSRLSPR